MRRFRDWLRDGDGWFVALVAILCFWVIAGDLLVGSWQDFRERRRHV